jgi:hypothetical protein
MEYTKEDIEIELAEDAKEEIALERSHKLEVGEEIAHQNDGK